ncbi:MAG: DUF3772 domain-containing protein, partial [Alphaproteobacteria bacterium]|nr:DUF3772 domain-containing protein [Alphaproteobacteria bacterium]
MSRMRALLIGLTPILAISLPLALADAKPVSPGKENTARSAAASSRQNPAVPPSLPQGGPQPLAATPPAEQQIGEPMGPPAPPPQAPPSPDQMPIGPLLDQFGATLKDIKVKLEEHDLTDAELLKLRQQIDPISAAIEDALDRLTPRLENIKTRLDQLGPKPNDSAPPESPVITKERADQQKMFDDTTEFLKRARLLAVQATQMGEYITALRRALFTRSLFARAQSLLSPSLWAEVWREAPSDMVAIESVFGEWIRSINNQIAGDKQPWFWGSLGFLILLFAPMAWLTRRVLARQPTVADPGRFLKIRGAWWILLVLAVPAAAFVLFIGWILSDFNLTNERLQPFLQALGGSVIRIGLVAGTMRGLFAPTRPNWRLAKISDRDAEGITRSAVTLAIMVSLMRLFEALNDIVGSSLPVAVTMRGVIALLGTLLLSAELWRFDNGPDTEENFNSEIGQERSWLDLLRMASWVVMISIFISVLAGYTAFGSFLLEQYLHVFTISCLLFMLVTLTDETIARALAPSTRIGHRLITSIGFSRNGLELSGALVAGLVRLVLFAVALGLVLAPWGLRGSDVPIDLNAAFFGFQVGGVTVSPFNIFIAIGLFALAFGLFHGVLQWLDAKLFPHMNFDLGLRNSIRTSLGYLSFLISVALGLGYLGLSFEKLALVAGALSVGIGFGLQSIVNNFVSGLILLWERAVRVGDWIIVGSDQGYVRRINVRSTEIETFDRAQVIIPNSSLVTGVVTNLVRNDRTGRFVIPLTVSSTADPERVREVLFDIAKSHDLVLKMPTPQILFTGMTSSTLNFELRAFVGDVEKVYRVKSDLYFEIFKRFKEERFFEDAPPGATKV